jgi:hypothetical protein
MSHLRQILHCYLSGEVHLGAERKQLKTASSSKLQR